MLMMKTKLKLGKIVYHIKLAFNVARERDLCFYFVSIFLVKY